MRREREIATCDAQINYVKIDWGNSDFFDRSWRQRDDVVVLVFKARECFVCVLPVSFNRIYGRFCDIAAKLICVLYRFLKKPLRPGRLVNLTLNMDVKATEMSFIRDNPLLLPMNKKKTVYDGFITVQVSQHVRDALVLYMTLWQTASIYELQ